MKISSSWKRAGVLVFAWTRITVSKSGGARRRRDDASYLWTNKRLPAPSVKDQTTSDVSATGRDVLLKKPPV